MANPVSPEKRRYRPFFIVVLPCLFLACLIGMVWVLLVTRSPLVALPLAVVTLGPTRLIRWVMIWLSTPKEQELLGRKVDLEPLVGLIQSMIKCWRGGK